MSFDVMNSGLEREMARDEWHRRQRDEMRKLTEAALSEALDPASAEDANARVLSELLRCMEGAAECDALAESAASMIGRKKRDAAGRMRLARCLRELHAKRAETAERKATAERHVASWAKAPGLPKCTVDVARQAFASVDEQLVEAAHKVRFAADTALAGGADDAARMAEMLS